MGSGERMDGKRWMRKKVEGNWTGIIGRWDDSGNEVEIGGYVRRACFLG